MDSETSTDTSDVEALSVDHLVALVRRLEQTIAELQVEKERLKQQLNDRDGQHPTQRLDEEYSLEAEDKRTRGTRRKKQKSPRRGRRTTARCTCRASSGGLKTVKPYSWRLMFTVSPVAKCRRSLERWAGLNTGSRSTSR